MADFSSPLRVGRLIELLKETVEDNFFQVAVEGEISNLSRPASGHLYFTLKDEQAQIKAAMFRGSARSLRFSPEDGMQVVCRGRATVYSQRGELQLVVDAIDVVGSGGLQVAFEQLKQKLSAEGLFSAERKRPLPAWPRTIGVVTSATGAVIHDILRVLDRRGVGVRVVLCPVRVQGNGAAEEIAAAIARLNTLGAVDVLIVGRGGGSLEDLWAFNEEVVARAIIASKIPVISAVGHEVDVTIADYVADLRAATPTAAAEQVAKSRLELEAHLDHLRLQLAGQMRMQIQHNRQRLTPLQQRLVSPQMQLKLWRQRAGTLHDRLQRAMLRLRETRQARLSTLASRLDVLSPLRTLDRGYAIALREDSGAAVLDVATLSRGERLHLRLARGAARVVVDTLEEIE